MEFFLSKIPSEFCLLGWDPGQMHRRPYLGILSSLDFMGIQPLLQVRCLSSGLCGSVVLWEAGCDGEVLQAWVQPGTAVGLRMLLGRSELAPLLRGGSDGSPDAAGGEMPCGCGLELSQLLAG